MHALIRCYMLTSKSICLDQKLYARIIDQLPNTEIFLAHTNPQGPQQLACASCRRDNDILLRAVP